jgi:hypothetical protein
LGLEPSSCGNLSANWFIGAEIELSYLIVIFLLLVIVVAVLIIIEVILILEVILVEVVHAVLELESLAGEPVDGAGNELLLDVLTELVVELELLLNVLVDLLIVI